jgi:hypothetical protein
MPEILYTDVVWTAGDTLTEAKLDNMVANDRAVDALNNGVLMTERANPDTPSSNKLHLYVKDKSGIPTLYVINDAGTIYELSETRPSFLSTVAGSIIVGTSQTPIIIVHRDLTIVKAYGAVKTAPVGASIIVDINKNGSSIWNSTPANRLAIGSGSNSGSQTAFDTTTLSEGDQLTFDLDQVGATTTGADLSVLLRCKP